MGQSKPLTKTMEDLLSFQKGWFFTLLCLSTFVLLYVKKSFIENETAAFSILEQNGEMGVLHFINNLQYLSIPLFYIFKFSLTALLLWIGCFMFGYRITYRETWSIVMVSEIIFFLPETLKISWFVFVNTDPDIFDIRAFYPFSLIHFFDHAQVGKKWLYPLKSLNVFELVYWFLLTAGIHVTANKKYETAQWIVMSSYVFFFLLWLVIYVVIYK